MDNTTFSVCLTHTVGAYLSGIQIHELKPNQVDSTTYPSLNLHFFNRDDRMEGFVLYLMFKGISSDFKINGKLPDKD